MTPRSATVTHIHPSARRWLLPRPPRQTETPSMIHDTPYLPGWHAATTPPTPLPPATMPPPPPPPLPPSGERRRDAAHRLLEARRSVYILRGRRALLTALLAGAETVTADDVRAAVELPHGIDPRCLGAVPTPLADAGIIRADGYATSRRAEAHARPMRLWRLVDADAARRWLAAHPDRPDPDCGAATGGGP
ncbi:MAG: hypothetical protein SFX18_18285 [Pirellulales bacterium]|nr:hypothetical protein [Pirellulales bacterium]